MEGKKGSTKAVQYLSYGDADILNAKEIKMDMLNASLYSQSTYTNPVLSNILRLSLP